MEFVVQMTRYSQIWCMSNTLMTTELAELCSEKINATEPKLIIQTFQFLKWAIISQPDRLCDRTYTYGFWEIIKPR